GLWSFITLNASCMHRNMPVRLMSTTFCHFSRLKSSSEVPGAFTPALLNTTSTRPHFCFTAANSAFTESCFETSVGTQNARAPAPDSCAAFSSTSLRRPASATCQRSFRNASAAALPTPLPAPVMIAILLMNASPGTRKSAHGNAFRNARRPSGRDRRAAPPGAIPGVPRAPASGPHGVPGAAPRAPCARRAAAALVPRDAVSAAAPPALAAALGAQSSAALAVFPALYAHGVPGAVQRAHGVRSVAAAPAARVAVPEGLAAAPEA